MYQVNILDSNYYPVRQVYVTDNEISARVSKVFWEEMGNIVGIMYFES